MRLQTTDVYKGPLDCIVRTVRSEVPLPYFECALSLLCFLSVVDLTSHRASPPHGWQRRENAIQFIVYEEVRRRLRESPDQPLSIARTWAAALRRAL